MNPIPINLGEIAILLENSFEILKKIEDCTIDPRHGGSYSENKDIGQIRKNLRSIGDQLTIYRIDAPEKLVKRGKLIADKLAALITEKMEKRANKGDWKDLDIRKCYNLLYKEVEELDYAIKIREHISNNITDHEEMNSRKKDIIYEIADVAAYCAIMLDVLEKE